MNAVEFTTELSGGSALTTTELSGGSALTIPIEIAAQLPKSGTARIIVLTVEDSDADDWRAGAYASFSAMIRRKTPSTRLAVDVRRDLHSLPRVLSAADLAAVRSA